MLSKFLCFHKFNFGPKLDCDMKMCITSSAISPCNHLPLPAPVITHITKFLSFLKGAGTWLVLYWFGLLPIELIPVLPMLDQH